MDVFVQLPERVDPAEPKLRLWSGDISEIQDLLNERKRQVANNWFERAGPELRGLHGHPWATKAKRELKQLSQQCVESEAVNQEIFKSALLKRYDEEITLAKGNPQIAEWYRPGRVKSVEKRWAPIVLLMGF